MFLFKMSEESLIDIYSKHAELLRNEYEVTNKHVQQFMKMYNEMTLKFMEIEYKQAQEIRKLKKFFKCKCRDLDEHTCRNGTPYK